MPLFFPSSVDKVEQMEDTQIVKLLSTERHFEKIIDILNKKMKVLETRKRQLEKRILNLKEKIAETRKVGRSDLVKYYEKALAGAEIALENIDKEMINELKLLDEDLNILKQRVEIAELNLGKEYRLRVGEITAIRGAIKRVITPIGLQKLGF